ncbi:CHASE domain-containing protein [Shewanella youngdeokensis]|uniref:histidine kinase n=1 Tax=Shewanella youngdeokensis TaxID=2999068 RepID=A0ABZ0JTZ9_9GAMM|nr:CHASE domain-containing protein [Shewanella sp. DAU334]
MVFNNNRSNRYLHWLVLMSSVLLTFVAWKVSDNQIEDKRVELFKIQVEQLLDHVTERMTHYEVALKTGAAAVQFLANDTQIDDWSRFAESLHLPDIYPGINGIGVIYKVETPELDEFLAMQRNIRPDFKLHPEHGNSEYWPITYIYPVKDNQQAVGLDIAFEHNRLSAAHKARNTGNTQITAPIVLVQDAKKKPGFLQYIAFYDSTDIDTLEQRQQHFVGLVYAPFIMHKLIEGTLEQSNRQLIFSIFDGENSLYNELKQGNDDYDPDPLLSKTLTVDMYGRPWTFNIQTAKSFREFTRSKQPLLILSGGIVINLMLLVILIMVSNLEQRAITLANKEEYYRHIIETAPCGMIITNLIGIIEHINPQVQSLFGYRNDQLIGKHIEVIVPDKFNEQLINNDHFQIAPSNPKLVKAFFGVNSDGTRFPIEVGESKFEDDGVVKTITTIIDMTEYASITAELKRSNKELDDFAYVASHDLKAPLRGIMQLSSWIKEDVADYANDMTNKNLVMLMNRTMRLEKLLEDLLSYSRIGKNMGMIESINIEAFVINIFELQTPPSDVSIFVNSKVKHVMAFIAPLETILRNLIGNAIKHKQDKKLLITVSVTEVNQFYQFAVKDNGPGIKQQHHQHIFELFKTLRPRDEVEGSGMGLSIIKKLLDYQGGAIQVESDGVSGTRFVFTLPMYIQNESK